MIAYQQHFLDNGLEIIIHEDHTSQVAVTNLLYKVGSRDESPDKTGFAHLFEHLMFGGSLNVESFDNELQKVGGENNAFTSPDFTNYYISLPSNNLETAFWLESDRMNSLSFKADVLETQRNVVIEEFKQRYLNQPYGDYWLLMRPLAYKKHSYRWPTIGKSVEHIEKFTLQDVKDFFYTHYTPDNAILSVAGDVNPDEIIRLAEKYFGPIESAKHSVNGIPEEPIQQSPREDEVKREVPYEAIYKCFHMPARTDPRYYPVDILSDVLGRGRSSLLYENLVKKDHIFHDIQCFQTGSVDPGLLVISGKLNHGVSLEKANQAIESITEQIKSGEISERVLEKVKNQVIAHKAFSDIELLNRALNLAFCSFVGNIDNVNQELEIFDKVTLSDVINQASSILDINNSSTLFYRYNKS